MKRRHDLSILEKPVDERKENFYPTNISKAIYSKQPSTGVDEYTKEFSHVPYPKTELRASMKMSEFLSKQVQQVCPMCDSINIEQVWGYGDVYQEYQCVDCKCGWHCEGDRGITEIYKQDGTRVACEFPIEKQAHDESFTQVSEETALEIAQILGLVEEDGSLIDPDLDFEEFCMGIGIEFDEHGANIDSRTDVIGDSLISAAKIAYGHLKEGVTDYYSQLIKFEKELKNE